MNNSINAAPNQLSNRYSDDNDGQTENSYMDSKMNLKPKTLDARSW